MPTGLLLLGQLQFNAGQYDAVEADIWKKSDVE